MAKAVRKGLDELRTYYAEHPSAVYELGAPSPIEPHTWAAVVRRWLKARQ